MKVLLNTRPFFLMVTPYEVVTDSNVKLELELALGLMVNIIHEHDERQHLTMTATKS